MYKVFTDKIIPAECGIEKTQAITPMTHHELCDTIADFAQECLIHEVETWPKPGLVSHIDNGSHKDMNGKMFLLSAAAIRPYFYQMVEAGLQDSTMKTLRALGIEAEKTMLAATNGVNTHRGAIFGLGLLCAAAGLRHARADLREENLGHIVAKTWGDDILDRSLCKGKPLSHGEEARKRYGVGGAREEAYNGFPAVYQVGLPALHDIMRHDVSAHDARVHLCFALIAKIADTNLLYRGGEEGLAFAQHHTQTFLAQGSVLQDNWHDKAKAIHDAFIERNLSPGGTADLLSMTLFVSKLA